MFKAIESKRLRSVCHVFDARVRARRNVVGIFESGHRGADLSVTVSRQEEHMLIEEQSAK